MFLHKLGIEKVVSWLGYSSEGKIAVGLKGIVDGQKFSIVEGFQILGWVVSENQTKRWYLAIIVRGKVRYISGFWQDVYGFLTGALLR